MGFTDDDCILIENLYIFEGYGAKNLLKSFQIKVGLKLTEQITELFEYFACLFCIVFPCTKLRNCLKKLYRFRYHIYAYVIPYNERNIPVCYK